MYIKKGNTVEAVKDVLDTCEALARLPNPTLDLNTEIQVLNSLQDTAYVLQSMKPELVAPVCQILLRELGRIPENERKPWRHAILSITPETDESIMRAILKSESFETIARWIIENPHHNDQAIMLRLETLFRSLPYHSLQGVAEAITHFHGVNKIMVRQAITVIRPRMVNCLKALCEDLDPKQAPLYLNSLYMIGGPYTVPLIKHLLTLIHPNNTTCLKIALKAVGDLQDRAYVPFFKAYLQHSDYVIRQMATDIVSSLGGPFSVELLKHQVQNGGLNVEERKFALSRLAAIADPAARKVIKNFSRPWPFGLSDRELRLQAKEIRKELCSKSGSKAQ